MSPRHGRIAARLADWLDALATGDGARVVDGLADGVVFETPADAADSIIPYVGRAEGKAAVLAGFATRAKVVETVSLVVKASGTSGRHGFAEMASRERTLDGDRVYDISSLHLFTFDEEGRIARWQSFFDPDPEVAALAAGLPKRVVAAVAAGDAEGTKLALACGASPDTIDARSGLTLLMIAAARGHAEVARLLIEAGANVHMADAGGGATALHKAAQAGALPIVRMLCEAGAFVDCVAATTGHTPLMDAIWFGSVDVVGFLLDHGASLAVRAAYGFSITEHFDFEAKLNSEKSAGFLAMKALIDRHRAAREALVGRQRLMAATVSGDVEGVRAALAGGADVNERAPITGGFNNGHTPLHVAARDGHDEIVTLLLAAGADVNAVEPTFTAVPLHKSVYNGHAGITAQLAAVPGVNFDVQGATNGYTPLHDALWHGFADCADILIAAGARLDLEGHDGQIPLDIALRMFGDSHPTTLAIRNRLGQATACAA